MAALEQFISSSVSQQQLQKTIGTKGIFLVLSKLSLVIISLAFLILLSSGSLKLSSFYCVGSGTMSKEEIESLCFRKSEILLPIGNNNHSLQSADPSSWELQKVYFHWTHMVLAALFILSLVPLGIYNYAEGQLMDMFANCGTFQIYLNRDNLDTLASGLSRYFAATRGHFRLRSLMIFAAKSLILVS